MTAEPGIMPPSALETEEWFRSLFENMQEGFAYCRMLREPGKRDDFLFLAVNQRFAEITGLEAVVGQRVSEVVPGIYDSNPEFFEIYGGVAFSGKPATFETWIAPLGRWFSISAYCPRPGHFVAIASNITERKRIEQELRDTIRRLEFATAAGNLGIWEWNIESGDSVWNDKMYELYDVNKENFRPCFATWLARVHPDDRATVLANQRAIINGERECSQEYRVVRPDGSLRYIKVNALLVRNEKGQATQLIGLNRDITESKLAVSQLDESEKRFRQVVEGAPQGIFVHIDGYLRYLNPAGLSLFGAETADQLLGTPIMDRIHPDCHGDVAERIRILREERRAVPLQHQQFIRLDGSVFDAEVNAGPIQVDGRPGIVSFFRDITKHCQLEEQFRHAQKMESIGRVAGGVAHDFNNLLTVINGYAALAMRALTPADPLREWIDEIGKAGENAAGLTRQLLAFSRKQILMPQTVDLNLLIAESGDMLQRLVGEDIAVVLHLAPDLGRIWADPGQLHQVLLNLVVNARDAMPDGGRLTIATANLGGGEIVMTVSDSGIGMDKAIQDRIFDPFFTTKGEGEGTGLGLASVYGIVKQCGGSISVASEPAHGATFTICLPRTEASTGQQESSSPDTSSLRGTEIVLVVDDQEPLRKLVARTLRGRGYLVLEAESAIAALAITEQSSGPIRLLITDVVMPHMNGKELSASFEQLHPQCKVLYMSGYGTEVIAKRGVTIPRSHYIAKPFTSDALAVKVREILGCQRAED